MLHIYMCICIVLNKSIYIYIYIYRLLSKKGGAYKQQKQTQKQPQKTRSLLKSLFWVPRAFLPTSPTFPDVSPRCSDVFIKMLTRFVVGRILIRDFHCSPRLPKWLKIDPRALPEDPTVGQKKMRGSQPWSRKISFESESDRNWWMINHALSVKMQVEALLAVKR